MNKQFERRLRRLERRKEFRPRKRWVPQWLSDAWHKDTGLPFDTWEEGVDSFGKLQERDYRNFMSSQMIQT